MTNEETIRRMIDEAMADQAKRNGEVFASRLTSAALVGGRCVLEIDFGAGTITIHDGDDEGPERSHPRSPNAEHGMELRHPAFTGALVL